MLQEKRLTDYVIITTYLLHHGSPEPSPHMCTVIILRTMQVLQKGIQCTLYVFYKSPIVSVTCVLGMHLACKNRVRGVIKMLRVR